ncbi:flavin reductase (DIM6/NTAB) family NADH-FMN oxidoreductase RutF [Streptomyces olivoverticillatus]|uniref:Flavin reductase (DIM6/NTAB) family NADH-FMN oxidoreductase RutF n=1 Tax=Streptomyces olivoverticillatus TaxID=66427 RepID=A0A7W7LNU6_9ACTN|nr:flavin reductase family protein [Streptomyces olivoverticillatus]MBB4893679.1 flavin reductase (DIM6/NTAB) family NADH-FMN oxidoreductase RutF [Streptomyces olivoverticillatus]
MNAVAAVRRLASAVSVLTVAGGGPLHGTTASSVGTVSRDPLLVCVCLRSGSRFSELARDAGTFAVNVLSSRQALLADWFARPGRAPGPEQFAAVGWSAHHAHGAPLLDGAMAWLGCRITGVFPGGDHDLLLAEVTDGAAGEGRPLLSCDGRLYGAELYDVARRTRRHDTPHAATPLD